MTIKPEITFIENILKQNELLLNIEYDLLGIVINNEEIKSIQEEIDQLDFGKIEN